MTKKVVKKAASKPKTTLAECEKAIIAMDARIVALESRDKQVIRAFRRGANEIRPLFGLGAIAGVLDGVADRVESR